MQTPALRLINPSKQCSFVIKEEPFDLHTRWHYHKEVEIMYFSEGKVSAIVGNRFTEFDQGDLVLFGSEFPHVIFEHKEVKSEEPPSGVVIQFKRDFAGDGLFGIPELSKVDELLQMAVSGLHFRPDATANVAPLVEGISLRPPAQQFILLIEVLTLLSEQTNYDTLTVENAYNRSELDEHRMQLVKEYIYEHFRRKIKVSELAELVNMTETSFCRYYKSRTLKSLTQTLNEIRVSYACELLRNGHANVTEACYQSGFTSPAFFSRIFKRVVGVSPSDYRGRQDEFILRW